MLTRRTALGALPAGIVLDADFVTSAHAQASPPLPAMPRILKPSADNILTVKDPKSGQPSGFGLIKFVEICKDKDQEINLPFDDQLNATKAIIDFLKMVYADDFPSRARFKDYVPAIRDMGKFVRALMASNDLKLSGGDRGSFGAIYKRTMGRAQEIGYFPNRKPPQSGDFSGDRLKELSDALCKDFEDQNPNRDLGKTNFDILTLPPAELDRSVFLRRARIALQVDLNSKAETLLELGLNLATKELLQYHAAMEAYCVYYFVLKILLWDPRRDEKIGPDGRPNQELAQAYGRFLELARVRTIALLTDAFDFFDIVTGRLVVQSETLRRQLNEIPAAIYIGSEIKAPYQETERIIPQAPGTPAIPPKTYQVDVPVVHTNYYLKLIQEDQSKLLKGVQLATEKAKRQVGVEKLAVFGTREPFPPFRFPIFRFIDYKILSSKDMDAEEKSKLEDINKLNDREMLGFNDAVPEPPEGPPDIAKRLREFFRVRRAPNKDFFEVTARGVVAELNQQIDNIKSQYLVQVEFNCQERMAWSFLEIMGRG